MKPIDSIDDLHKILLAMAKVFHQVCVEERIPYYMIAGTQLGATRHKGFIPWDDDMDFGVPREYFKLIRKVLENKLPEPYHVYGKDDGIVTSGILKICDDRTIHSHKWDEHPEKQFGVNIDIFPLDRVSTMWKRRMADCLMRIQGYKLYSASDRPLFKKISAYIVKTALIGVKSHGLVDFVESHLVENWGTQITNIYGCYGAVKETMPQEWYGKPVLNDFEDTQFYGVANPHEYLTHLYGDYMQLPPEEKQRHHIVNMYWK